MQKHYKLLLFLFGILIIVLFRNMLKSLFPNLYNKVVNIVNPNYNDKYLDNIKQKFDNCLPNQSKQNQLEAISRKILSNKDLYVSIANQTNRDIPFYLIGLLHYRESDFLLRHLHNGDPLTKRTVNVPKGRPIAPPKNGTSYLFIESAIDALNYDGIAGWNKKFDIPNILYLLERYNGFGYNKKGVDNPYLWASSNQYTKGKYTSDGSYNPNYVDTQIGVGTILKYMKQKNYI